MSQKFGLTYFPSRWRLVEPNETTPQGAVVISEQPGEVDEKGDSSGPNRDPLIVRRAAFLAFLLSGASSLIFQSIWSRMLHHVFGATSVAISTVVTAFMAGLGLGAFVAGKYADKLKNPLRAFVQRHYEAPRMLRLAQNKSGKFRLSKILS